MEADARTVHAACKVEYRSICRLVELTADELFLFLGHVFGGPLTIIWEKGWRCFCTAENNRNRPMFLCHVMCNVLLLYVDAACFIPDLEKKKRHNNRQRFPPSPSFCRHPNVSHSSSIYLVAATPNRHPRGGALTAARTRERQRKRVEG